MISLVCSSSDSARSISPRIALARLVRVRCRSWRYARNGISFMANLDTARLFTSHPPKGFHEPTQAELQPMPTKHRYAENQSADGVGFRAQVSLLPLGGWRRVRFEPSPLASSARPWFVGTKSSQTRVTRYRAAS